MIEPGQGARACGLAFAALAALLPASVRAQAAPPDGLTLTASTRIRAETIDGQARAGFPAEDDLVGIRTLVALDWRDGPWRIGGELQDARAYGADPGSAVSNNDVDALEPFQAYIGYRFDRPFGAGTELALLAGRQTVNIGSRRLVASDEYRGAPNSYTGLRIDARLPDSIRATAFALLPQRRLPEDAEGVANNRVEIDRESFRSRLWGATVWRDALVAGTTLEASFVRYEESDAPRRATRDRRLSNGGVRAIRPPASGRLDWEGEAIVQWGTTSTSLAASAPTLPVRASFVHADIGYTFPGGARARLSVEYDRAGGDAPGGRFGRFDTLFGMRRADLAPAGIYAQIGRANISTPGVRLEIAPGTRIDAFAVYRLLWSAESTDAFSTTGVRNASGGSGSFAGAQLEGRVRWWALPDRLRLEANAVWLDKGRFLRDAPGANPSGDVFYLSLGATLSFTHRWP